MENLQNLRNRRIKTTTARRCSGTGREWIGIFFRPGGPPFVTVSALPIVPALDLNTRLFT